MDLGGLEEFLRDHGYGSKIRRSDQSLSVDDLVISVRGLMAKVGMLERGEWAGPSEEFYLVDDACEYFASRVSRILPYPRQPNGPRPVPPLPPFPPPQP